MYMMSIYCKSILNLHFRFLTSFIEYVFDVFLIFSLFRWFDYTSLFSKIVYRLYFEKIFIGRRGYRKFNIFLLSQKAKTTLLPYSVLCIIEKVEQGNSMHCLTDTPSFNYCTCNTKKELVLQIATHKIFS
jgi:hypothetical protein